ncbi:DNA methyltransferase [Roseobacter weihaiensis]|uniref:DNA methyltransferase n=1 Tax=Roseobacter weihaiensis TaxID=2763262 RepID=UPI001D09D170|nr:DNA methyltransferase [Roseobacter sp. H9]
MQSNQIIHGESANILRTFPEASVDLVVTDPPYLVNYRDRNGRSLQNDNNAEAVMAVFDPMARVMKPNSYAVCFAGWGALPQFSAAWEAAGLRIVGQIVWHKRYASRVGFTQYRHESAYILAKGKPARPTKPLPSVMEWVYSGNRAHPTEKAVEVIAPLIRSFSKPGDLVLDPFCGSGSTCVAATLSERQTIGIELDKEHITTAHNRLAGVMAYTERQKTQVAA